MIVVMVEVRGDLKMMCKEFLGSSKTFSKSKPFKKCPWIYTWFVIENDGGKKKKQIAVH